MDQTESTAIRQIDADRFQQAEMVRETWAITVEQGTSRSDILNPGFWSHVAYKLRPYARIEVRCDDGSIFADLIVLNAERTWARVHVMSWHDLTTRDVSLSQVDEKEHDSASKIPAPAHQVEWKGPHKKWSVIRVADSAYVHEGDASRQDAELWLREHERATA